MNAHYAVGDTVIIQSPYEAVRQLNGFEATVIELDPECGVMFYIVDVDGGPNRQEFGHNEILSVVEYQMDHFEQTYEID